jgi:inositol transport system permease protein
LPVLALTFLLTALVGGLALRYSRYGRSLYLIGSNPRAARISGLPIARITLVTYSLSGLLAGFGGIALLARSGVG